MRHRFGLGDTVYDYNMKATIIELPRKGRRGFAECYLTKLDRGAGHDGLGYAKVMGQRNLHWAREDGLRLIKSAIPLTPLEKRIQAYIDAEFKELGL